MHLNFLENNALLEQEYFKWINWIHLLSHCTYKEERIITKYKKIVICRLCDIKIRLKLESYL